MIFDSIIREYETCEDTMTLTEQEKRSSFYQAAASIISELRSADLITRQTQMKEMSLETIKSFILQLEAEKKTDTKEEIRVQRVYRESQQASEEKCYRYKQI